MTSFDPAAFSPALAALLQEERLPPLGPGTPNTVVRARLAALTPEQTLVPHSVRDTDMASACLAGLWLYHDFLDESHKLSQDIDTPTGSYWHGLVHRREPDYDNARYWFRRVGVHPVFGPLREAAAELVGSGELPSAAAFLRSKSAWDAFAFIGLCQAAAGRVPLEMLCRQIQRREWELLFEWCYRRAIGASG